MTYIIKKISEISNGTEFKTGPWSPTCIKTDIDEENLYPCYLKDSPFDYVYLPIDAPVMIFEEEKVEPKKLTRREKLENARKERDKVKQQLAKYKKEGKDTTKLQDKLFKLRELVKKFE